MKIAITGSTGKIGGAVVDALLSHSLISASDLIICTSTPLSSAKLSKFSSQGLELRYSNYSDPDSMRRAFTGCDKLFLVSTPDIALDFYGEGREKQHIAALQAAQEAGVQHIYYTSLAYGDPSKAAVMRAHLRTEAYLREMKHVKITVLREGLYNESWPLYFGHYLDGSDADEVLVAGDGPVSWTAIKDLGVASALVLADQGERYVGKTFYLSNPRTTTLQDVAKIVERVRGRKMNLRVVERDEYVRYYVKEKGLDMAFLEWVVTSFEALEDGECAIKDPTFTELLSSKGIEPKSIEESIEEMLTKK